MTLLFLILIVLSAVILGFLVLIQNPKGGGLSGNIAGISNQFMGVKQTTDVLEKGTWIFAGVIGVLCLLSSFFLKPSASSNDVMKNLPNATAPANNTPPAGSNTAPAQGTTAPTSTPPKP